MKGTTVIRERLLENNKVYLISLGRQIHDIIEEGVIHVESLSSEDNNALLLYRAAQEPVEASRNVCELCSKSFKERSVLLRHIREVHNKEKSYECQKCLKPFSRQWNRNQHATHCNSNVGTYIVPSYIRGYHVYNKVWTPNEGMKLDCLREYDNEYDATAVMIMYNDRIAGYVPRNLSGLFTHFLNNNGMITAEVVGSVIDRGYGLEVPVNYIFNGNEQCIYEMKYEIESLYNM